MNKYLNYSYGLTITTAPEKERQVQRVPSYPAWSRAICHTLKVMIFLETSKVF